MILILKQPVILTISVKELHKIPNVDNYKLIIDDIVFLLNQFKEISEVKVLNYY